MVDRGKKVQAVRQHRFCSWRIRMRAVDNVVGVWRSNTDRAHRGDYRRATDVLNSVPGGLVNEETGRERYTNGPTQDLVAAATDLRGQLGQSVFAATVASAECTRLQRELDENVGKMIRMVGVATRLYFAASIVE
jgi:hypothetical protein